MRAVARTRIDAGYAFLIPVILLWGWNPLVVARLSTRLPILEIDFLATALALASMALIMTARNGWKGLAVYSRRDFRTMALTGIAGIFPYTLLLYLAFALAPRGAAEINILNYLWPILTLLFSGLLLKERLSFGKIMAILVSFAGVCLLMSGGHLTNLRTANIAAYAAAGSAAAFWALFSVLTKRFPFDPLHSMFVYDAAATVLFAFVAVAFSHFQIPSLFDWALLLVLGVGVNGLGYLMWILALRVGNTARMAGGVYLVPFVALAYLALFGQDIVTLVQIASLVLVLAGPTFLQWFDARRSEEKAAADSRTPR